MDYHHFANLIIKELIPVAVTPADLNVSASHINTLGLILLKNFEGIEEYILRKKIRQWIFDKTAAVQGSKLSPVDIFLDIEEQLRKNVFNLLPQVQPQQ
jgi:hypothetical protein